jgi:drug/metabolite transporter (DMT)-like permease
LAALGVLIFVPVAIAILVAVGALLRLLFQLFGDREQLASRILFWLAAGLGALMSLGGVFYLSTSSMTPSATDLALIVGLSFFQVAFLIGLILLGYKLAGRFFRKVAIKPAEFD